MRQTSDRLTSCGFADWQSRPSNCKIKFSPKLDLGATAPPHDGNHSTCGYLGVIWTPWRDSNSQIGLIPLSLCRERRSKKVTHFPALWKCQDMAWANPGIERRLQSWLLRSLSYRRKAQLPFFTLHCHTPHLPCESIQDVIPLQNRK